MPVAGVSVRRIGQEVLPRTGSGRIEPVTVLGAGRSERADAELALTLLGTRPTRVARGGDPANIGM
jgi:hypothetical protein